MSAISEQLDAIHVRLVEGLPTASLELFQAGLRPLIGFLMRETPGMPREVAYDRAVDTLIGHTEHPELFDRTKSSLWSFLCLVAKRDALDLYRKSSKRENIDKKAKFDIELWNVQAKEQYEAVEIARDAETIMRLHGQTIVKNEIERKVLDLLLDGEREHAPFATAMGLDDGADSVADVKRMKDKLNLRLKKVFDEL
jgi:DNA-directed RNA polymerase specialized sigma24 family protein